MNYLDELRVRLSVCDEQILECLLRRNRIVEDIMKYKESHNMQIIQPEQEKRQAQKLADSLQGQRHAKEIRDVFNRITYNSKKIQARHLFHYNIVLIGFMGSGKSTFPQPGDKPAGGASAEEKCGRLLWRGHAYAGKQCSRNEKRRESRAPHGQARDNLPSGQRQP